MSDDLAAKTAEFCTRLRDEHGFSVGLQETVEAVRSLEIVGIGRRDRVAAALRAVCCSRPTEIAIFDRVFASFFSSVPRGLTQPRRAQRRRDRLEAREAPAESSTLPAQKRPESESLAQTWQALLARYSPAEAAGDVAAIPAEGLDAARREASRLVTRLHLGRSLRWKPQPRGERFDLRRTLRASLRTGGEMLEPHTLGHPLRNPRFVLLLDGSRSMSEHAGQMLQFAYALCTRTRRARAFLFSTRLHEVTRKLREADRRGRRLEDLGEAWGGGTRIGASLEEFVRRHRAGLTDQTFVVVISDGLDVGAIPQLRRAMREMRSRCAAIAWINPYAARAGYAPSARGMLAALPYLTTLTSFKRMDALTQLGRRSRVIAIA
jgi:uncharacterized protein